MRALQVLFFLFAIVPAAVLAHDAYFWYEDQQNGQHTPFTFSEIGYLWFTYSEETHDAAVEQVGGEAWNESVKPFLRLPAFYVSAVPPAILGVLISVLWLFGKWPFNSLRLPGVGSGGKGGFAAYEHEKKTFRYKRR